ncbi:NucA/NucB deoxyribonuclease domain-containing protein [Streptomyces sp. NPDC001292]|uniref:NucA/NucB deoxyribonuclease domain-containing protein n=1 Tax=Streptomyces sp. NPDC001292 TaxID=3364558 RepID=UPI0036CEDBD8
MRSIRAALATPLAALLLMVVGGASPVAAASAQPNVRKVVTIEAERSPDTPATDSKLLDAPSSAPPSLSAQDGRPKRNIPQQSPAQLKERVQLAQKFQDLRESSTLARAADLPGSAVECQDAPSAQVAQGLVIDHFTWCQFGTYLITLDECTSKGCTPKARVGFRLSLLGVGEVGSREISFVGYPDNFRLSGVASELLATPLTFEMKCSVSKGSACIDYPLGNKMTQTIQQWIRVPSMFFKFSSPETNAVGTDLLSWYDFWGTATITGGNTVTTGANGFRCDSATYVPSQGCVFDQTEELWYDLYIADPDVNETAQHIIDAQEQPEVTFPMWLGKTVPGSIYSGLPLNRIYHDTRLRDNNHAQAVRTCRQFFGTDYSTRGLDCDEYPFQSTIQGAAAGDNRYSARALDSDDNQAAGRLLGKFYDRQRVLDSDPFYVIVIQ